jgi:hypothetical protein
LDSDGDGLPDDWEIAHQLNPNSPDDAAIDSDGDGLTNLQEYQAGTDPRSVASSLRLTAAFEADQIILRFAAVEGRHYRISVADAVLGDNWSNLADVPAGPTRDVEVSDAQNSSQRFYRLELLP